MRPLAFTFLLALTSCSSIFGIPSEGSVGCPSPCTVTVSGRTVRAESPGDALPGVVVRLGTNMVTSGSPNGGYSFSDLPPGTMLQFNLHYVPTNGDPQGPDVQYLAGTTAMEDITVNLPMVQFRWLAAVAFQCNIFASMQDALNGASAYLNTRSTVIGQVLDASGNPTATFDRQDITVFLKNAMSQVDYPNPNPADTDPFPTKICFLELDPMNATYKGVDEDHSTSGRFIVFRVVNDRGTGTGTGRVEIPGFPAAQIPSLSAGSVGFVQIRKGDGPDVPPRKLSFSRDVYHFFSQTDKYLCTISCHRPGGAAVMPQYARTGPGGVMYLPDWSASSQAVYNNLTLSDPSFETDCDVTPARVCTKKPDASLLYRNPTGMASHSGQVDLTPTDPFMMTALQWITDGALP